MTSNHLSTISIGNFTFVEQLNILLGNKCTAQCDFCTNDSSPKGDVHLAADTCRQLVKAAKSYGFKAIGFSGGEPFLYRKLLLELADLACKNELEFVIATNGYWGKSYEDAVWLIDYLKIRGLKKLQLSYDVEHAKYVSKEAINNVLHACANAGINVLLYSAFYPGERKVEELLDLSKFDNVTINQGQVFNVGRAKNNLIKLVKKSEGLAPIGSCPKLLQMTVNFDGEIYPCCSVGGFSKGLRVGNIVSDSFDSIQKSILSKSFVFYLQHQDARWIADELTAINGTEFRSICEVCNIVHSNDDFLKKYTSVAQEQLMKSFLKENIDSPATNNL